jgi:hypothetical protein
MPARYSVCSTPDKAYTARFNCFVASDLRDGTAETVSIIVTPIALREANKVKITIQAHLASSPGKRARNVDVVWVNTVSRLSERLSELERLYFERLSNSFRWTDALRSCITGAVQFAVIDSVQRRHALRLPVVCTVGINYTQGGIGSTDGLVRYHGPGQVPSVERATACRPAVALAIAAYNRNTDAWVNPVPGQLPTSPANAYGATTATRDSGLTGDVAADFQDGFILVMTNLCPFITQFEWQRQVKRTPLECHNVVNEWPREQYLDDLYQTIGESVDLWIGHSAIYGTDWVWPKFLAFTQRNNVANWLLTPNISPRAHLYLDRAFRTKHNPLFPLFGPERNVGASENKDVNRS